VSAAGRLAAYGLVLAAVIGGGAAVGAAAGPIGVGSDDPDHGEDHAATTSPSGDGAAHGDDHTDVEGGAELPAGGLLVAQDGYRFAPEARTLAPGVEQPFAFRILGPDGAPLEDYEIAHDKQLHLVVVSRDLGRYAHVHPERAPGGTWSVTLPALAPGSYRAFADFAPTGHRPLTLGVDLTVAGTPAPPDDDAADRRTIDVAGYTVALDGDLAAGEDVTVTVRRGGEAVTTEPYLGAAGHLVAIRDGDLAYLHVHPLDEEPAGPVRFAVSVPSEGRYGLYFDFAHEGVVHTAAFLVTVVEPAPDAGHAHPEGEGHR
jgi:hypothetical protein